MTRSALAAILAISPISAFAETQLERFEGFADSMNDVMVEIMAFEIESQGGDATAIREATIDLPGWNDEMRTAAGCILDRYADATSSAEVDNMLDRMEEMIATVGEMSMDEFAESDLMEQGLPGDMTDEEAFAINTECGMMELQMEAMRESGLMEAMMTAGATIPDND